MKSRKPVGQTAAMRPVMPPGAYRGAPQQTAPPTAPPKNERGPFAFAPEEKFAAFVLGALVWCALAYNKDGLTLPAFSSYSGAADVLSRLLAYLSRDTSNGPMAFSASVGAAFFARFLCGVPVRGLSRWACFLLSLPLFQVVGVAGIVCLGKEAFHNDGGFFQGVLLPLSGVCNIVSFFGGVGAFLCAIGRKRERSALIAVPLLWGWQLVCLLPWSVAWLDVLRIWPD